MITALHDAKAYPAAHLDADIRGGKVSEDQQKQLSREARKADEAISRARDAAGLLISEEAQERLRKYLVDAADDDPHNHWVGYLDRQWDLVDTCLKSHPDRAPRPQDQELKPAQASLWIGPELPIVNHEMASYACKSPNLRGVICGYWFESATP